MNFLALLVSLAGLVNGGFEAAPTADGFPPGWTLDVGARTGGNLPLSRAAVDRSVKRGGAASLHLAGDDKVRAWRSLGQDVEARPGATYKLTAHVKTRDVAPSIVEGTRTTQRANAYVGVWFYDASGAVVGRATASPTLPTADWHAVSTEAIAPDTTERAHILIFLSMSGDLWVDDVDVAIEGGRAPTAAEILFQEDFEGAAELPAPWTRIVGATKGRTEPASRVEIDSSVAGRGSGRSLHLSSDASTRSWWLVARHADVAPGDVLDLACLVRADGVRKDGDQFENFHVNLAFEDAHGRAVGTLIAQNCDLGSYDWKDVTVRATAPAGAARVRAGLFVSMSGSAWFDDVVLKRRTGAKPAYEGWKTLESKHVILRHPSDHPRARDMRAIAARFDTAYESARRRLAVQFDEKVTVYLYSDAEQGRRFTGRPLAFASPSERAVHQTTENTVGHELTHVIALGIGYSQCALFGEGVAVWHDGEPEDTHHDRAATLLKDGALPSLETLLARFREDESKTYPAAGSFTGFVIATCGLDAFKRIYVAPDPVASAPKTLGKSLEELDRAWREFLSKRAK